MRVDPRDLYSRAQLQELRNSERTLTSLYIKQNSILNYRSERKMNVSTTSFDDYIYSWFDE